MGRQPTIADVDLAYDIVRFWCSVSCVDPISLSAGRAAIPRNRSMKLLASITIRRQRCSAVDSARGEVGPGVQQDRQWVALGYAA